MSRGSNARPRPTLASLSAPSRSALAGALLLALLLLATGLPVSAADPAPDVAAAEALARDFLAAFAAKDMETVGSMFAPAARVQRARLGDGAPELAHFDAAAWLAEAGESIAPIQDFRIEVLGATGLAFDDGVTVTVRFRATGALGEELSFVNDGVDTFSLVPLDGALRIVLYNSMEKLVLIPEG